jgi:hypothetical protein
MLADVLEIMEQRHDWAKMTFTFELFKYVLTEFLPEVIVHSKSQDEEQVRDHYDSPSFSSACSPPSLRLHRRRRFLRMVIEIEGRAGML